MKKLLILTVFGFGLGSAIANERTPNQLDSAQHKQRLVQLEKQVEELNGRVKTLQTQVEKQNASKNQPKKLYIERRGTKQAYFQ